MRRDAYPTRDERLAAEPAPKDPRQSAACHLKRRYATRADAKRAKRQIRHKNRGSLHAYHCDYCGLWHLGHAAPARDPQPRGDRSTRRADTTGD